MMADRHVSERQKGFDDRWISGRHTDIFDSRVAFAKSTIVKALFSNFTSRATGYNYLFEL